MAGATLSALCAGPIALVVSSADLSCFRAILGKGSYEFPGKSFYDNLARVSCCSLGGDEILDQGLVDSRCPSEKMW